MGSKNLIIYEYDTLFNILIEINEVLNFDLIKADKNNFNEIKKGMISDFLIVSKNIFPNTSNQIILKNFPLSLDKLIEQINVEFLKNKFNLQSDVKVGVYNLNLNSRQISKNDIKLDLTERECKLIIYLSKSEKSVRVEELQREVWDYESSLETHTVETHIYRLRKKINEKFNDNEFIISLKDGYVIN